MSDASPPANAQPATSPSVTPSSTAATTPGSVAPVAGQAKASSEAAAPAERPVLCFHGVSANLGDERFANIRNLSFTLNQGRCVAIALEDDRDSPIPGLAIGERVLATQANLLANAAATNANQLPDGGADPDLAVGMSGRVLFEGIAWENRSPQGLLACRGRIGWVLSQPGWVNNLSVLENVLLRQLHHTRVPRKQIVAAAQELAYAVDLAEVPARRMSSLSISELRRAEWVRAFLGWPSLVMLQRALHGIEHRHYEKLATVVRSALTHGTAVLWMANDDEEIAIAHSVAECRYRMSNQEMKCVGGDA